MNTYEKPNFETIGVEVSNIITESLELPEMPVDSF